MTDTNQSWHFHASSRMVLGETESDVICFLAPRQPQAVGQLLAAAPTMAGIALDLRLQLRASIDAWEGEEESVQEEHADLIDDLKAAEARADAILDAPADAVPLNAETLRVLALSFLARAEELDGLKPHFVTHTHRFGETPYMAWAASPPTEEQMAALLEEEFEADRGESLTAHGVPLDQLAGVAAECRVGADLEITEPDDDPTERQAI